MAARRNRFFDQSHEKENEEREPLIYKPESSVIYSTIDTLTLSLVPNIPLRDEEHPGIGWVSAAFGLANAAIGVGVLNFPAAYNKIGGTEIATIVQLMLITLLFVSITILIYCSDLNKSNSYHEILSKICGKRAELLVAGDICLATFGICVAYLIVIGDQYDRIFASLVGDHFCHYWYLNRRFTIFATAVVICPLCFLKRLDFLRHTGPLGIISMIYIVFLTVYEHYALSDGAKSSTRTRPETAFNVIAVIPVMCFGYQCNEVIVPIYASMKNRTPKSFYKAVCLAYGVLIFLYGTVGYFGYITFGSTVHPDVITMFDARDPWVMIGIIALILKMIVTYPQMCFVGRGAFEGLVSYFSRKSERDFQENEKFRRTGISSMWFLVSLILAIFAPDIEVVIEALGSLAAANIFLFPSLCLISLAKGNRQGLPNFVILFFYTISFLFLVIGTCIFFLVFYQVYTDISGVNPRSNVPLCRQ